MKRRRVVLGSILFFLAAVILVLMNRYTSIFNIPARPEGTVTRSATTPYAEFYDHQTGERSGRLTAARYATREDGGVDWEEVSLDLLGTAFGRMTVTCDRAVVKLEEMGKKASGRVALSGNIRVNAVADGETTISGTFEDVTYDLGPRELLVKGPFEIVWGEGVSLSGVDARGNLKEKEETFRVERDVRMTVSEKLQPSWAFDEGRAALEVTAGGPMDFDIGRSAASFGGGVKVTRGASEITCGELELAYSVDEGQEAKGPDAWELQSVEARGRAKVTSAEFAADAEKLVWDAATLRARVEGAPGSIAFGEDRVTAQEIDARLSGKGQPQSVACTGPGTAEIKSVRGIGAEGKGSETPEALVVSWDESASYDVAAGTIQLKGSVNARQGAYRAAADAISISLDKEHDRREEQGQSRTVSTFEANRGVSATDGENEVKADRATYDGKSGELKLEGNPASLKRSEGEFTARRLAYSTTGRTLSARQGCKAEIWEAPEGLSQGAESAGPVTVTARQMDMYFSRERMTARATGTVKVDSGEGVLTCDDIEVTGVEVDLKANEPAVGSIASARIIGRGHVKFQKDETTATGDSFVYDRGSGMIALEASEGKEVEISVEDSATVWARKAEVYEKKGQVVCEKPRIFLTAQDMVMGFLPGEKQGGESGQLVKVYLNANGRMVITQAAGGNIEVLFDGGVEGVKRGSESKLDDRLTAGTLVLDIKSEERAAVTLGPIQGKTTITAARASGGVYIRYAGPEGMLEGNGESFEWDRAAGQGNLAGNPAAVTYGQAPPTKGGQIIYDFAGRKIMVKGDRGGSVTMER